MNSSNKSGTLVYLAASVAACIGGARQAAAQTTYYVNGACGSDAWTGQTSVCLAPDGPKATIQAGINAAGAADTVVVADGTYTGAGNKFLYYAGAPITLRSQNGPQNCIIDCEGSGVALFFVADEPPDFVVDGFTMQNGNSSAGGAIFSHHNCRATITNCILTGNNAFSGGAILCETDSSPTFVNCTIVGNTGGFGAGVSVIDVASPTFVDCTIADNTASLDGGGVYVATFGTSPTFSGCTIAGNQAARGGGGVYGTSGSPILCNCTIEANTAADAGGGVFAAVSAMPMIARSVVRGNTALLGAGIFSDIEGFTASTIVNTWVVDNIASADGGGLFCRGPAPQVVNTVFAGNTAGGEGGAVLTAAADPAFINCTFSANSAGTFGGAIAAHGAAAGCCSPSVVNSILWSNAAPNGPEIALLTDASGPAQLTVSFSDVAGGQAAVHVGAGSVFNWLAGNIDADPLFADPADDNYRLSPGSPSIDAGYAGGLPAFVTSDLDGHARVLCGQVDLGAYESGLGDFDCNQSVDLVDYAQWANCLTGPDGGPHAPGCLPFDAELDEDIDLRDLAGLQTAFTGTTP